METIVRRVSTAEAVADHLITRIRGGDFGPGDRFPSERKLQEQLGVGRLALREGLARLSALGVIRVDHGKGASVRRQIDPEALERVLAPAFPDRDSKSLRDLVDARILLEGELAALAAERRTDADVKRLEGIVETSATLTDQPEPFAQSDNAFHREIARIAGNRFLGAMRDALAAHIAFYITHAVQADPHRARIVGRHRGIVKAIAAGDSVQARDSTRQHIAAGRAVLEAFLRQAESKGN